MRTREAERKAQAQFRRRKEREMHKTGIRDPKIIENRIAVDEYEMQKQEEKKKKARYSLQDPTKMSVNIGDLIADQDSEMEEYGDVCQLKQDLPGVEIDFRFLEKPIEPLKIDAR